MKINSNVDLIHKIQESSVGTYLPDDVPKIIVNIVLQCTEPKVLHINSFDSWFYWFESLEGEEYWEDKFMYLQGKVYANKI